MSKVPSSFNIFDVTVRLFPGCMLCMWIKYLFFQSLSFSSYESVNFMLFLSAGFSFGALLYAGGNLFGRLVDRIAFGGSPRKIFMRTDQGRISVIRDDATRKAAERMVKGHEPDYVIGRMINYLEIHGFNGKEDRMLSLAGMSSSLAVTVIVCLVCGLFHPITGRGVMVVFALICFTGFTYSYIHFTRTRYAVIVRTCELVKQEEKFKNHLS